MQNKPGQSLNTQKCLLLVLLFNYYLLFPLNQKFDWSTQYMTCATGLHYISKYIVNTKVWIDNYVKSMILGFHWKYYNVNCVVWIFWVFFTPTSVNGNTSSMCCDVTNGAHVARHWLPPMGPTRSCPLPNLWKTSLLSGDLESFHLWKWNGHWL